MATLKGMKRNNISFQIEKIPQRKKPCLFVIRDNQSYKVGQIDSMVSAEMFIKIMDYVCFGNGEGAVNEIFDVLEGTEK